MKLHANAALSWHGRRDGGGREVLSGEEQSRSLASLAESPTSRIHLLGLSTWNSVAPRSSSRRNLFASSPPP